MRLRTLLLTSASLVALAAPKKADACGGLFCGITPVVQAEEAIIFDVDPPANEVTAIINVVYQGNASEFVWVLPLQTAPESIEIGSQQAFLTLQTLTTPSFQITEFEDVGMCTDFPFLRGVAEDADLAGGLPPAAPQNGEVTVVSRENVGPYDTVVLEGEPAAVRQWLLDNQFQVTDEMMDLVTPYIAKGDTLLALKLLNDKDVGEIRPIEVKMTADLSSQALEACIPIRMTAMAANTDMPITGYFFTNSGRAYPKNFYHVIPNLLKIDWLSFGSNYRQVIGDAVDEADAGHAFVTEFSGRTTFLKDQVFQPGSFDEAALRSHTDLGQFLQALIQANLLQRAGMRAILEGHFQAVKDCPSCSADSFNGQIIDANPVVDDIESQLIAPDQRAQAIMDNRTWVTRLFTMLDPDEMTLDPIFDYNAGLEEISNVHTAKMIRYCGVGGAPGSAGIVVVLDDGRRIYFDGMGQPNQALIDAMPAAERIEQLDQGIVVADNRTRINDLLDDHNSENGAGCGCSSKAKTGGAGFAGLLLLAGLAALRRRK
jgi:MYXO-CTERM domain-containing protein